MGRLRIALLFFLAGLCTAGMGFSFICKEVERNALLKFKYHVNDESGLLSSWMGQDCCSWKGVGCDKVTSNVIKLDLRAHGGNANFYPCLYGEVNPAILKLKHLRYLDLSGNIFYNGSRIPEFFGSMRQLRYLNLSNTFFGGKFPRSLGNLTQLVGPGLNNLEWAFKLENLKYLDLSKIDLSEALDSLYILNKLPSLSVLNLAYCRLGNSHQVMRNSNVSSSLIHHLDLSGNLFNGPIPHYIQNLSSIRFLDLSSNHFNSLIPSWLANKRYLEYLSLSKNHFKGVDGGMMIIIGQLCRLKHLDLSYNQLQEEVSESLVYNLSQCSRYDLKRNSTVSSSVIHHLDLSGNLFSGPIPHYIQNLSSIRFLDLSSNHFNSPIPSWLANKRYLEYLSLSKNHFKGVDGGIMIIIGHLCRLKHLDLSYNQLQEEVSESLVYNFSQCSRYDLKSLHMENNSISGHFPTFESLLSLQELDLSHNNFKIIPSSFGKLLSLESVDLSYNHLSVVKQDHLANLSSLRTLDMSSNSLILELSPGWLPPFQLESLHILPCKLNSPFPKWLLTQEKITELDLSNTGIFGPLPDNIGNAMPSLGSLQLANNDINGSIPESLCELASLEYLGLKKNRLSGKTPDCWVNSRIQGVELSSNELSGSIPHSLTEIDTLQLLSLNNNSLEGELPLYWGSSSELMVVDVGNNNLHGQIPAWDGENFLSLEILILRGNKFKGAIPPQLCSVFALQIIDLASNNLDGTIPQCFGHFEGMSSDPFTALPPSPIAGEPLSAVEFMPLPPAMNPDEWSAVEVIKGQEREYTTVLHLLVNMDLSCNNLEGVVPAEITSLSLLVNLNLSHNHLAGAIPKEIGKMKSLESLDLSSNNLSGTIPESISSLNYLSKLNLSFNNLQGRIPTGSQLQTLGDQYSIYMGNPGLCGDPLPKCYGGALPPTSTALEDEEEEDKHDKLWLYLVIMLGFATGFWGVIGVLVVNNKWRHAYFAIAEELADWIYVRVAVRIARAKGGR